MHTLRWSNGEAIKWPPGKIVCIGRNYADHAKELNNPVPERPLLFIKPATSAVDMLQPIRLPEGRGSCHHETEMALLIGAPLSACDRQQAASAIAGYAVALDLTLRDLQSELKQKGHPWELAKAFDGACPLSPFQPLEDVAALGQLEISLAINGEIRQQGNSRQMLMPPLDLLCYISRHFTLLPGDLVLTGTPAGVGPLNPGDALELRLGDALRVSTRVAD